MEDFGLYLVMTNPVVGYERCCEAAVNAGVRMVQLRMKDAPRAEVVAVARALRRITAGSRTGKTMLPHAGHRSMRSCSSLRRRFPGLKIVGKSTHSPAQALAAVGESPDYIGAGPVWPTPTKKIPDPTLGVEAAAEMARSVPFPAVAIGGIDESRLPELAAAGLANFAVVRAVCAAPDPYARIVRLQDAFRRARGQI